MICEEVHEVRTSQLEGLKLELTGPSVSLKPCKRSVCSI